MFIQYIEDNILKSFSQLAGAEEMDDEDLPSSITSKSEKVSANIDNFIICVVKIILW